MRRLAAFVVLAGLALQVQPAYAQYENRAMSDRLDRLERDLQMMQSTMARGGASGGSTVITSPALGGGANTTRPAASGTRPSPIRPAGRAISTDRATGYCAPSSMPAGNAARRPDARRRCFNLKQPMFHDVSI